MNNEVETRWHIVRAVAQANLNAETAAVFALFYIKRFGEEYNVYNYVLEWAYRFQKDPISYMDTHSKLIYLSIIARNTEVTLP